MPKVIISAEYGSRMQGVGTVDSDHDIMDVVVEDPADVMGIGTAFVKGKSKSTALEGQRSGEGDTDITTFGLRHWARLAANGNPTAMTPLFVPEFVSITPAARLWIIDQKEMFVSKRALKSNLGYMIGQRAALEGMRNKKTNRPELVHKYGYDTKFAYHMIRVGLQGIQLGRQGTITLPMLTGAQHLLGDIRMGKLSRDAVLRMSDSVEKSLRKMIAETKVPDEPDYNRINLSLRRVYESTWTE